MDKLSIFSTFLRDVVLCAGMSVLATTTMTALPESYSTKPWRQKAARTVKENQMKA